MRTYLKGSGAAVWGTKDVMWERILLMEKHARGERALQQQLAEDLERRRAGQDVLVPAQLPQPVEPTAEERRGHELTHVPSKPWCRWCQMGKAKQLPHRSIMEIDREPGLPRIEMDYGILKVSEQDNHAEGPRAWATFLVAVHVGTGMSCAIAVEHKGKHGLAVAENVPQAVTPNPICSFGRGELRRVLVSKRCRA